jgi:hypothetical protein
MNTHVYTTPGGMDPRRLQQDQRIDRIGWGIFFMCIGALWLMPRPLPSGMWLTTIGVLLLAVNVWRVVSGLPLRLSTSIVGAFALLTGIGLLFGVDLPVLALMLIAIGVGTLTEALLRRRA